MRSKIQTITAVVLMMFSASASFAAPLINVYPSLAPNQFGSPSFSTYVSNALAGLQAGGASVGAGPAAYSTVGSINASQNVVSDFPLWMGVVNPGGILNNELGNRLHFGLVVTGAANDTFTASEVSFVGSGSFLGELDFTRPTPNLQSALSSNPNLFLVDKGAGYVPAVSGDSTATLQGLIFVGYGNAYQILAGDFAPASPNQSDFNAAFADIPQHLFNGQYFIDRDGNVTRGTASVLVNPQPIPEPASIVTLMGMGICGGVAMRIRRRKAQVA